MRLTNLQIINGGQTTASLRNSQIVDKTSLNDVFVPMKLTILHDDIGDEDRMEMVRNISKFSNTQNKVNASDLASGSKVYVTLEKLSRKIQAPICAASPRQTYWYFERNRGQYERDQMELTKAKREAFKNQNPVSQRIKITDIAKFWNSVALYPYDVSWGGQVNSSRFQERIEELYDDKPNTFNDYFYKQLIAKAILFLGTRTTIMHTSWYEEHQGILALITPYTVSKFVYECSRNKRSIDWMSLWRNQTIGKEFEKEIIRLSEWTYKVLDKFKKKDNFGEWCKMKEAWEVVKDGSYELSLEVKKLLISEEDVKAEALEAKKERQTESNIEDAMIVFQQGAGFWQNVYNIAIRDHLFVNSLEADYVLQAIKACKKMNLLDNKPASVAMKIQRRMEADGYPVTLQSTDETSY